MRRALYVMLNLVLAAALAFVIWLIIDKVRGPHQPKVVYELIVQDDISRQVPDLEVKLMRLILQIERGKGLAAVRDYLRLHKEEGSDAYSIISNSGGFLAIGERFGGELERVPEEVKRVLGPCREATRVGKEGSYRIYRCG